MDIKQLKINGVAFYPKVPVEAIVSVDGDTGAVDTTVQPNSDNLVTSGAVYTAIQGKSTTWTDVQDKPNFATVATSGSYSDLDNKPNLFSGSYNDLTDKPTIPSAMTVDSALNANSTNPVQNKVVNGAIGDLDIRLRALEDVQNPFTVVASASPSSSIKVPGSQFTSTVTLSSKKGSDTISGTTYYYKKNSGSWQQISGNSITLTDTINAADVDVTYTFKGVHSTYGEKSASGSVSFKKGSAFVYGIEGGTLTVGSVTIKPSSAPFTFTTGTNDHPVVYVPASWGNITKVTDLNNFDVTSSWANSGTVQYNIGSYQETFNIWRKTTTGAATNFKYTFTL